MILFWVRITYSTPDGDATHLVGRHDLRHYTASLLLSEGVPMAVVSSLLGHSGIGVTVDTYGHLSEQSKREAIDQMARVMG